MLTLPLKKKNATINSSSKDKTLQAKAKFIKFKLSIFDQDPGFMLLINKLN